MGTHQGLPLQPITYLGQTYSPLPSLPCRPVPPWPALGLGGEGDSGLENQLLQLQAELPVGLDRLAPGLVYR